VKIQVPASSSAHAAKQLSTDPKENFDSGDDPAIKVARALLHDAAIRVLSEPLGIELAQRLHSGFEIGSSPAGSPIGLGRLRRACGGLVIK
jgi:hypothetical protein